MTHYDPGVKSSFPNRDFVLFVFAAFFPCLHFLVCEPDPTVTSPVFWGYSLKSKHLATRAFLSLVEEKEKNSAAVDDPALPKDIDQADAKQASPKDVDKSEGAAATSVPAPSVPALAPPAPGAEEKATTAVAVVAEERKDGGPADSKCWFPPFPSLHIHPLSPASLVFQPYIFITTVDFSSRVCQDPALRRPIRGVFERRRGSHRGKLQGLDFISTLFQKRGQCFL
jgi:hypothetical protein